MEQLVLEDFLKDDAVKDMIARTRVTLIDNTGDNLQAGDGRIVGLRPNRYYLVEVRDENYDPTDPPEYWFVGEDGHLKTGLGDIGRVTDGVVNNGTRDIDDPRGNLDNELTYVVFSAAPLTGNMIVWSSSNERKGQANATNNGIALKTEYEYHFLELPTGTKGTALGDEYAMIITDLNQSPPSVIHMPGRTFSAPRRIRLDEENTSTDYVFFDGEDPESFKFLKVFIGDTAPELPPEGDLSITLAPFNSIEEIELEVGGAITIDLDDIQFPEGNSATVTIVVSNTVDDGLANFIWTYNGVPIPVGTPTPGTFTINFAALSGDLTSLTLEGTHIINVRAIGGGKHWSAFVTVIVTDELNNP